MEAGAQTRCGRRQPVAVTSLVTVEPCWNTVNYGLSSVFCSCLGEILKVVFFKEFALFHLNLLISWREAV